MRFLLICGVALVALASAAQADVIYDFTFTETSVLMKTDAAGTFSTGAASPQDTGYFLVTGLNFSALADPDTGGLNTGSLTATLFDPGAAYDPTTQAFISHAGGDTSADIGSFTLTGSTTPVDLNAAMVRPPSFAHGNVIDTLLATDSMGTTIIFAKDLLTITPQVSAGVPEPSSIVLLATGFLGLFGFARGRRMATTSIEPNQPACVWPGKYCPSWMDFRHCDGCPTTARDGDA